MLIQLFRLIDSVAVVATICATVLLAKHCVCVSEEDDEILEKKQLAEFYSKCIHSFAAAGLFLCK